MIPALILAAAVPLPPFPVDHFARTDSPADVRFLLDAPAGKYGFIHSENGHLFTGDGRRIRLCLIRVDR